MCRYIALDILAKCHATAIHHSLRPGRPSGAFPRLGDGEIPLRPLLAWWGSAVRAAHGGQVRASELDQAPRRGCQFTAVKLASALSLALDTCPRLILYAIRAVDGPVCDVPVYVQLASILRARIESGELAPRRPVPSKRVLVQEFGIAGGTVDKAIGILRAEGLVRTVTGRGIYVVPPAERPA